ncbi:MAG: hypothetical protein LBF22_15420 [Deltaproteobacteria bacterium]|jgi:hypothetical protein|nr:hypothetical protein [Deltaproteobacteria bacterium]
MTFFKRTPFFYPFQLLGKRSVTLVLFFLGLICSACGVKTHPYPELVTLPGPVLDLTQEEDDVGNLYLSWRAPERNMAGRELEVLSFFTIERATYASDSYCEGCPAGTGYERLAEMVVQPPPPGLKIYPGTYYFVTALERGKVYRFRIGTASTRGAIHPQAYREFVVLGSVPPGALEGFRARAEDRVVRLSIPRLNPGEEVEIERRENDGPFLRLRLPGDSLVDTQVSYDNTYTYRARRVNHSGQIRVLGPYAAEVRVRVEDITPPRPISYLDATLTQEGIALKWESLADQEDLKGYRLYRQEGVEGTFVPLGGILTTNTYLDKVAATGTNWRYRVTAIDTSPRANESLPSPVAEVWVDIPDPSQERPNLLNLGL